MDVHNFQEGPGREHNNKKKTGKQIQPNWIFEKYREKPEISAGQNTSFLTIGLILKIIVACWFGWLAKRFSNTLRLCWACNLPRV